MLLRIAMNTYVPVLDIMKNIGYKIRCELTDDNNFSDWIAIKEDCEVSATNPAELLGLVMVIETYGKDWNQKTYASKYEDYL